MKQTINIANEQLRNRAVHIVGTIPLDVEHEVLIRPRKVDRSTAQNSYYWRLITIIGNELGMTKDEMHDEYRGRFLVPIFTRDDPGYAALLRLSSQNGDAASAILRLTSTTQASVKQMGEYLDDISHHATSLGIRLPAPEWQK